MVAFWRACTPVLADAVPHYMAPCCYTLDPASRLITSHFQEGLPEFPPEWAAEEYAGDDVNQLADVARTAVGHLDPARGDQRRSEQQPAVARQHGVRRRPGDGRGAAHPGR